MRKKKIGIILTCISLLICILSLTGCNINTAQEQNNTKTEQEQNDAQNLSKHYEINLTMNNFESFLTIEDIYYPSHSCKSSGVLRFAYYEDIKIVIEREISAENVEKKYYEEYTMILNAAGDGSIGFIKYDEFDVRELLGLDYNTSFQDRIRIKDISGKVIFAA